MSSLQAPPGLQPSASYSFTMRIELPQQPGSFAKVAGAIGAEGAILGAIDLVRVDGRGVTRDVTVACIDAAHGERVVNAVKAIDGVRVVSVSDRTFLMHKGGKIEITPKVAIKTRDDLSMAYTPGVARVSSAIAEDPESAWALTIKGNTVAVVSDGTAVLGLGDIGPAAAMPVMEGKAMLFKELAGVDAFPLCLDTTDVDEIVRIVQCVAPTFGGINLEDIAAPRCFEVERRLKETLDIPVFHDDQHGTAVVVLAALVNALKVVRKQADAVRVVVVGAGAAGLACAKIILEHGVRDLVVCDIGGILHPDRTDLDGERREMAERTQPAPAHGPRRRRAGRRRRRRRRLRARRVHRRGGAPDGRRRDRVRDGQPRPRGPARGRLRRRGDHGHGPLRLPEPDQQRARVPGHLPRRAGRARAHDRRVDEARRRPRDRGRDPGVGPRPRVHHPQRVQPRGLARGRGGRGEGGDRVGRGPPRPPPPAGSRRRSRP